MWKIATYLLLLAVLAVGTYAYQVRQAQRQSLNESLSAFAQELGSAVQADSAYRSSSMPGFQVAAKVDVGAASGIWYSELYTLHDFGIPMSEVFKIEDVLMTLSTNIYPPYNHAPRASVVRAQTWIRYFANALDYGRSDQSDYIRLLRDHIGGLIKEFNSYKNDPNLAIP